MRQKAYTKVVEKVVSEEALRAALKMRVWPRRVASNHEGQRVTDKTDRTSVGLFATGATSGASGSLRKERGDRSCLPARSRGLMRNRTVGCPPSRP